MIQKLTKKQVDVSSTWFGNITLAAGGIATFWEQLQPVFEKVKEDPLIFALAFGWWVTTYVFGKEGV